MNSFLAFGLLAAAVQAAPLLVNRSATSFAFNGIGGLSGGGATSRLLVDYPEPQRSQILDYLFKPNFGASLHMLKVEIGGDSQSTDGTETSHMHTKDDLDLTRGYEWWLMVEAKKRNPDIKLYGLPWAFPGWVGNNPQTGEPSSSPFTYPNQTSSYIMEWVKGAKSQWNLEIDYIGIWNERASSASYAQSLKDTLAASGFGNVKLIAKDGAADICNNLASNPAYAAAIDIVGLHYPSDYIDNGYATCHSLNKPLWASEESSSYDDFNGAACWARVIHSHYVLSGITSSIMWNLVGSYYHGTNWYASSMMTAVQPWSGYWENLEVIWATAHVTQFSKVGWNYLKVGNGSGQLPHGGFYTTMVDDQGSDFSMWIVKISHDHAPCTRPPLPAFTVASENVTFQLTGFSGVTSLEVRYSNYEDEDKPQFVSLAPVNVAADGTFTVEVKVGAYLTLSTIKTSMKGSYTPPTSSPSLPLPHSDDFDSYPVGQEAKWWTDQIGAYEIQPDSQNSSNFVMRQMVPQLPIGWSDSGSQGPFTLLGMKEWYDVAVETKFRLPSTDAAGCVSTRSNQMWVNGIVFCVGGNGVWNLTYHGPPQNGVFTDKPVATGTVGSPGVLTWHSIKLSTLGTNATGWYDGEQIFSQKVRPCDTGFAAIGMNTWLHVEFDDARIEQLGNNWEPVQPCSPPTVGSTVKATPCQANGVTSSDQLFDLTSNWAIVHKPTGLCVEATASGALQMAKCVFDDLSQSFKNSYTLIRNKDQVMTLQKNSMHLVGMLNGTVAVSAAAPAGGWGTWAYYPNTFQLRNTYDTNAALGYPMCLSACA